MGAMIPSTSWVIHVSLCEPIVLTTLAGLLSLHYYPLSNYDRLSSLHGSLSPGTTNMTGATFSVFAHTFATDIRTSINGGLELIGEMSFVRQSFMVVLDISVRKLISFGFDGSFQGIYSHPPNTNDGLCETSLGKADSGGQLLKKSTDILNDGITTCRSLLSLLLPRPYFQFTRNDNEDLTQLSSKDDSPSFDVDDGPQLIDCHPHLMAVCSVKWGPLKLQLTVAQTTRFDHQLP